VGGAVAPGGSMMQGVAKLIFKVKKWDFAVKNFAIIEPSERKLDKWL